jgi:hypothetical protein
MYCMSGVSCLRLSYCINALNCCVHYLCLWLSLCVLRRTYRQDYETHFHVVILSKHHHHHPLSATIMSEYSSTVSRGAYIGSVFAMQGK